MLWVALVSCRVVFQVCYCWIYFFSSFFVFVVFFFKQKTAYEMRISDWSSDVCSSDLALAERIDMLEARLHALGEISDDARSRTLSATKSLSSQLTELQEATRSAAQEVTGMADVASGRIEATTQSARKAMEESRLDIEDRKSTRLNSSH